MNNLLLKKTNELTKRKKKGFTLVELIIVIAIIAILAAIAIPKFGAIRSSSQTNADIATAKNIATAVTAKLAAGGDATTYDGKDASSTLLDIDGNLKPEVSGKSKFRIVITSTGNVQVYYDAETTGALYPQS